MKRTEWKTRNEISEFLFVHVGMKIFDHYEWKGHIGEVWIEASQDVENIIINCYCFDTHFIRLARSKGKVIQFKIAPACQGLTQLRWFLEQIKKK